MSFSVQIVDAADRADLYVEIEQDGRLVAEVSAQNHVATVKIVDIGSATELDAFIDALERARSELIRFELIEPS